VEVLHAYAKPNPQIDAVLDRLENSLKADESPSGPSREPRLDCDPAPDDAPPVPPRPLDRRLTAEQREVIIVAYSRGIPQKDLAVQYGISDRSVKRLIAIARKAGCSFGLGPSETVFGRPRNRPASHLNRMMADGLIDLSAIDLQWVPPRPSIWQGVGGSFQYGGALVRECVHDPGSPLPRRC